MSIVHRSSIEMAIKAKSLIFYSTDNIFIKMISIFLKKEIGQCTIQFYNQPPQVLEQIQTLKLSEETFILIIDWDELLVPTSELIDWIHTLRKTYAALKIAILALENHPVLFPVLDYYFLKPLTSDDFNTIRGFLSNQSN